ncbi:MAG: homoserine kinase [Saprospiraceae bacterium]|nr:homoserine kinase [Saprospiraceae bacterium]
MRKGVRVFAPASVANVACGFDLLGFAIDGPGDEIIARESELPGLVISRISGDKGHLPKEIDKNTAGVAASALVHHLGQEETGIELEIIKKMPFGSGLGSSAASAAAAVVAVNELLGRPLSRQELLPFAVTGEQAADGAYHADNVAPALLGGMILIRDNLLLDWYRVPIPRGLIALVVHPEITILTKDAREIIRDTVSLQQHTEQSGNLATLILGLAQSNFEMIRKSLKDVIIEPQRARLIPYFEEMQQLAISTGALGCSISGAGPSIFALYSNSVQAESGGKQITQLLENQAIESQMFISAINLKGTFVY